MTEEKHSMRKMNLRIRSAAIVVLFSFFGAASAATTPSAEDYYESGEIGAGQKLLLQVSFDSYPVSTFGLADGFAWNVGSYSNHMTGSLLNFYVGEKLVVTVDRRNSNFLGALGIFQSPTPVGIYSWAPFSAVKVSQGDLDDLFSGVKKGTLEFIPGFSDSTGYVNLNGWAPFAIGTDNSTTFEGVFPAAHIVSSRIVNEHVSAVPEPGSLLLLLSGLIAISTAIQFRRRRGT